MEQASNSHTTPQLEMDKIPAHVAIIMDGNGRWATRQHLPRIAGHKAGMNTVKKIAIAASDLGIKVLTLYAFSTENWKRPESEVSYLMKLPIRFFNTFVPNLVKHNVRVMVMGHIDGLSAATQKAVKKAMADTAECDGMILNFALNYGGRDELVCAMKSIAQSVKDGEISPRQVDEQLIDQHLMTAPLGSASDPDLLIRTSGEERVSNFLLWQIAYSELVFVDQAWPDFDGDSLRAAISTFQHRHRRFGGLVNK